MERILNIHPLRYPTFFHPRLNTVPSMRFDLAPTHNTPIKKQPNVRRITRIAWIPTDRFEFGLWLITKASPKQIMLRSTCSTTFLLLAVITITLFIQEMLYKYRHPNR